MTTVHGFRLVVHVTYIVMDDVVDDVIAGDDDVTPCPNDDVSRRIHAASTANSELAM